MFDGSLELVLGELGFEVFEVLESSGKPDMLGSSNCPDIPLVSPKLNQEVASYGGVSYLGPHW